MTPRTFAAYSAGLACGFAAAWLSLWAVEWVWLPRVALLHGAVN